MLSDVVRSPAFLVLRLVLQRFCLIVGDEGKWGRRCVLGILEGGASDYTK